MQAAGRDSRYPFAYTYRDWVINAFNNDLPYDQFLKLQIAADFYTMLMTTRVSRRLGFFRSVHASATIETKLPMTASM